MIIPVITSIVGSGSLIESQIDDPRLKYTAFTNQCSNLWQIKEPCNIFNTDKMNAKIHKVLIHKYIDCNVSIWMDGKIKLLKSPVELIDKYMSEYDLILLRHRERYNLYQEADEIIRRQLDQTHVVINQIKNYKHLDSLFWLCFIIRKHIPEVNLLNEQWWAEICRHSVRDQLSFPELVAESGLKVKVLEYEEYSSYFKSIR